MTDTIIETVGTIDAACEIYGSCAEDFNGMVESIGNITLEEKYFINAWGATNSLLSIVAVFIYVEEVYYWAEEPGYDTSVSPYKEWYLTSVFTFALGTFNTLLWAL